MASERLDINETAMEDDDRVGAGLTAPTEPQVVSSMQDLNPEQTLNLSEDDVDDLRKLLTEHVSVETQA